ncbi:MAG: 2-C-methyl-D-erythritol 2,4-cyclodiphosphate synthase [Gemmatimonadales bacterium]
MTLRIGLGYDSHRFVPGRPLVLGGVSIPHPQGLAGHSDADAVAHALTDAILGAAGLSDIGAHFPPTDPAWKDADSIRLLELAHDRVREAGWRMLQADITVVAEFPRIGPHARAMAARLAAATGAAAAFISVKGKTNEGMGWIGRGEGVAVIAIASLEPLR